MKTASYIILYVLILFLFLSCDIIKDTINISKSEEKLILNNLSNNDRTEIKFDISDKIIEIGLFSDSKLISEWEPVYSQLEDSIEYYGNGQIKAKGYTKDGHFHSHWSYFDREGNLSVDRYFSYGSPTNIWLWYDKRGDIIQFEIFNHIKDDGNFIKYFRNGKIKEQRNYANTKLDGNYSLHYDNAKNSKKLEGKYKKGTRNGIWYQINEDGISHEYYHYIVD